MSSTRPLRQLDDPDELADAKQAFVDADVDQFTQLVLRLVGLSSVASC